MTLWVFSGRPSESAKLLSQEDGFRRMREGKLVKKGDTIVSWGCGDPDLFPIDVSPYVLLNSSDAIWNAINKLRTFQHFAGNAVSTVPWTANKAVAQEWLDKGHSVVCRIVLTGHEGVGIIVIEPGKPLVDAKLYTQYIDKIREFRVHATCFKAFATRRKVSDPEREQKDWKIRSYANGFLFSRHGIYPSAERDAVAVKAVAALGLDFGAVDLIEDKGHFYVLEVNTAPGIEDEMVPIFAEALKELAIAKAA